MSAALLGRPNQTESRFGASLLHVLRPAVLVTLVALPGVALIAHQTTPVGPTIRVRWIQELSITSRESVETQFRLRDPQDLGESTWAYAMVDPTREALTDLVRHAAVEDTHGFDRDDPAPPPPPLSVTRRTIQLSVLVFLISALILFVRRAFVWRKSWTAGARNHIQRARFTAQEHPFLVAACSLGALTVLCFGMGLTGLGFYWDEWVSIRLAHEGGPAALAALGSADMGAEHLAFRLWALFYGMFGSNPWPYHAVTFAWRWVIAIAMWWFVGTLWPRRRAMALMAACLWLVYPGYVQDKFGYLHVVIFPALALYVFSIGATMRGTLGNGPRVRVSWHGAALASAAIAQIALFPKLLLLELWRLIVMAVGVSERRTDRRELARTVVAHWAAYGAMLTGFVLWAVFFRTGPNAERDVGAVLQGQIEDPISALGGFVVHGIASLWGTVLAAWSVPVSLHFVGGEIPPAWSLMNAVLAALVAFCVFSLTCRRSSENGADSGITKQEAGRMALIGASGVVLGIGPVVLAGRHVEVMVKASHYASAAAPGVAILVAGVSLYLLRAKWAVIFVASLVGVSTIPHQLDLAAHAAATETQRQFWWQVAWRAPYLGRGVTTVYVLPDQYPWSATSKYDRVLDTLGGSYVQVSQDRDVITKLFARSDGRKRLPFLLIIQPRRDGCVRILDASRPEAVPHADGLPWISSLLAVSEAPTVGDAERQATIWHLFGDEPERNFCYYYQRASLAVVQRNWAELRRIGERVVEQNLAPVEGTELFPFIEGYLALGETRRALRFANQATAIGASRSAVCTLLERGADIRPRARATAEELSDAVGCSDLKPG